MSATRTRRARRLMALTAAVVAVPAAAVALPASAARRPASLRDQPAGSLKDTCARSRDLHVGKTDSALYSTVTPFEHFDAARTQVFPYTCTIAEIAGRGPVSIAARQAPGNYTTPYNTVTRGRDQLYVYGYRSDPQTQGAFVASINPVTLAERWRTDIKVPPPGEWTYPGVVLVHGNGYLYAIYGNVIVKLDPNSGHTLARRVLPEDPHGTGAAYNGMDVLPDGRIVAKGIERGPCAIPGSISGLVCAAKNKLPTPVVVLDPVHLRILSRTTPAEPITGRVTVGSIGAADYVYLAGETHLMRYRYHPAHGTLTLDHTWGPARYRSGAQTPGTGPALLGDWLVVQTNFLPTTVPMTVTAVNVHNSARRFQIRPFAAVTKRIGASFEVSKAAVDQANSMVYVQDSDASELVALHFSPSRGFTVRWSDKIRSLDFVALVGPAARRQAVITDDESGADRVVWLNAATGHLLARSPALATGPAPGNIVAPGFAGRFYYAGTAGGLWELHPVHAGSS